MSPGNDLIMDREAGALYRIARCDENRGAAPSMLIRRLLGADAIRYLDHPWIPGGGTLELVSGRWTIYLRRDLSVRQIRFIALHELAHWAMPGATERECDALAACLLAPRPAFMRAIGKVGVTCHDLADWFGTTETFAALRYGEVTGGPLVVVDPKNVRFRGRQWSWPTEVELRKLASDRQSTIPGVHKATFKDDPRRVALIALATLG